MVVISLILTQHCSRFTGMGIIEDGRLRDRQQSLMSIRDELAQVYDVWPEKSGYNTIFPGVGSGASQGSLLL